jgi:signal transduction histidine kinase
MMRLIDWWRNKPKRDAARSLLQHEADLNLERLKEWWDKLKPRKGEDEIHWVDKVVYAREFADAELPEFSREAYLSRQSSLSLYVRGDPFKRLVQFYANLAKVEEIHEELRRALEKDIMLRRTAEGQPASRGELSPRYDEFLGIAAQSWFHAANLIEQALSQGNPLGKRAYPTLPPLRKGR